MPRFSDEAYKGYDKALAAVQKKKGEVALEDRAAVTWFVENTPGEDEWIARKAFIDGSPALLMRSMLSEQGSEEEIGVEKDLSRLREALIAFAGAVHDANDAFPADLVPAAKTSIKYWKIIAQWRDRIAMVG